MKKICVFLTAVLLAAGCVAPQQFEAELSGRSDPPADELWVLNNLEESASFIRPDLIGGGTAFAKGFLTGSVPNRLLFKYGRGWLVASYGNSVKLFDPVTLQELGTVKLESGSNPWDCLPLNSSSALVTCFLTDSVALADFSDGTVKQRLELAPFATNAGYRARPEGIAGTNNAAWVACTGWNFSSGSFNSGAVAQLTNNGSGWQVIQYWSTMTNPQALLYLPDRDELHLICTGENRADDGVVQIFQASTGTLLTNLPVGGSPHQGVRSGDAVLLAGNSSVLRYTVAARQITHGSAAPWYSSSDEQSYLSGITLLGSRNQLAVTDFTRDRVLLFDLDSGSLLDTALTGDGPLSPAYFE